MQPGLAIGPRAEQDLVHQVMERIRVGLDGKSYENWIQGKVRITVAGDLLTVGVGSPFLLAWMQRQFSTLFREAARGVLGPSSRVVFEVDARISLLSTNGRPEKTNPDVSAGQTTATAPTGNARRRLKDSNPPAPVAKRRCATLESFVLGPESELAFAAATQLCQAPRAFQGPLYLFAHVGLGKTHLLEGIATALRRAPEIRQVAYFTAESFANYYTEALRARTMPAFRNRFRMLDALIIDDIDFFDGKQGLQQEFLHTVQHLEQRRRLIVLAGDRHPRLLTRTNEELVSRFLSGTVCRIGAPDLATRIQILKQHASRLRHPPSPSVLDYIAERFSGNVRELEGALNCLDVYAGIAPGKISVNVARRVLGDLERDCLRSLRLADIERAVCDVLGVEPQDVRSNKRARSVSQPRMVAMYLARKHTQATFGEIGAHFGGRNHSTVIAAVRKMDKLINLQDEGAPTFGGDQSLDDIIRSIEGQLRAS